MQKIQERHKINREDIARCCNNWTKQDGLSDDAAQAIGAIRVALNDVDSRITTNPIINYFDNLKVHFNTLVAASVQSENEMTPGQVWENITSPSGAKEFVASMDEYRKSSSSVQSSLEVQSFPEVKSAPSNSKIEAVKAQMLRDLNIQLKKVSKPGRKYSPEKAKVLNKVIDCVKGDQDVRLTLDETKTLNTQRSTRKPGMFQPEKTASLKLVEKVAKVHNAHVSQIRTKNLLSK